MRARSPLTAWVIGAGVRFAQLPIAMRRAPFLPVCVSLCLVACSADVNAPPIAPPAPDGKVDGPDVEPPPEMERPSVERLRGADVVLFGDVDHHAVTAITSLRHALPALHEAGFRRLALEFADVEDEAALTSAMNDDDLTDDDITWDLTTERLPEWRALIDDLRSFDQPWALVAAESADVRDAEEARRRQERNRYRWCDRSYAEEGVPDLFATILVRASNDQQHLASMPDTFSGSPKTVLFYGIAHGIGIALPGFSRDGSQLGFFGYHLRQLHGDRFVTVIPVRGDDWTAALMPSISASDRPWVDTTEVADSFVDRFYEHVFSDEGSQVPDCEARFVAESKPAARLFDLVFVDR